MIILNIDKLFTNAIKLGLDPLSFWDLTPAETMTYILSRSETEQSRQQQQVRIAWLIAKLVRAKRIPPLASLMSKNKSVKLSDGELAKRRREFSDMADQFNVKDLIRNIGDKR